MPDVGTLTTLRGRPAYSPGRYGAALSSGVLRAVEPIPAAAAATWEAWLRTPETVMLGTVVIAGPGTSPAGAYLAMIDGRLGFGTDTFILQAAGENVGGWHHLALTFDGTNIKLWVDGALQATRASTSGLDMGTGTVAIGGYSSSGVGAGDFTAVGGQIDEMRWSNVVRYTAAFTPAGPFTTDANTLALYHLDPPTPVTTIAPNDANIVYSPGNWNVTSGRAATINTGAYGKVAINGSPGSIALKFDLTNVSTPLPRIKARVDNGPWVASEIAASVQLAIPSDNTWTTRTVEWVVQSTSEFVERWNNDNAKVKFTGLSCTGTSPATVALTPLAKKILVFGDSITEGFRTLAAGNLPAASDSTVTWSHLQRNLLGVEVGTIGFGGTGWGPSLGQGNVPPLPDAFDFLYAGTARSFAGIDLVVVNYGENYTTGITPAAIGFLNELLAKIDAGAKVAMMRPFSGSAAVEVQAAIAGCADPSRVTYIDTTGWWSSADSVDGQHPYGYASQTQLGPRLANALRPLLGGGGTGHLFSVRGGVLVPLSI